MTRGQESTRTCGECYQGLVWVDDDDECTCAPGPEGQHKPYCGAWPCPNGCWDRLHPAGAS